MAKYFSEQEMMQFPVAQKLHHLGELAKNFKNFFEARNASKGFFSTSSVSCQPVTDIKAILVKTRYTL